jgi:anti-sigma-K factor RskA
MTCDELRDLSEIYALGLLEGVEKEEMDAHLARNCAVCRKSLSDALAVNALVLSQSPEVAPSAKLRRRVLASVGFEHRGWGWAAALAAACMLVLALWLSVQERQRAGELDQARRALLQATAQSESMQQALNFLNDPETRPVSFGKGQTAPPRGNVFVNPRTGVLLIASNLPSLIAGRIYEMWIIPKEGAPRPAGRFRADASGTAFHVLSGPVDLAAVNAVAVSVEPEAGSPAPTTTPIIVAPVGF